MKYAPDATLLSPDGAFSIINDSKYGLRAKERKLSLNLLRSPVFPDESADRGDHTVEYGIIPDGKGIVVRLYEALGFRTADTLSLSFPYAKVEECNLVEEDRRKLRSLRLEFSPFEIKTLYFTR